MIGFFREGDPCTFQDTCDRYQIERAVHELEAVVLIDKLFKPVGEKQERGGRQRSKWPEISPLLVLDEGTDLFFSRDLMYRATLSRVALYVDLRSDLIQRSLALVPMPKALPGNPPIPSPL